MPVTFAPNAAEDVTGLWAAPTILVVRAPKLCVVGAGVASEPPQPELASHRYPERFLEREAELDPRDLWLAKLTRGERAVARGVLAEAEACFDEAIRLLSLRPDFVSTAPWESLGYVLLQQGRQEEGYALFEEATVRAQAAGELEAAAWALAELANELQKSQDWERWHSVAARARALENEAHQLPPDAPHPVWDYGLARFAAHEGRWTDAAHQMNSVVAGFRETGWRLWEADALYELAFSLERQGREGEAGALYDESVALFQALNEPSRLAAVRRLVAGYSP